MPPVTLPPKDAAGLLLLLRTAAKLRVFIRTRMIDVRILEIDGSQLMRLIVHMPDVAAGDFIDVTFVSGGTGRKTYRLPSGRDAIMRELCGEPA